MERQKVKALFLLLFLTASTILLCTGVAALAAADPVGSKIVSIQVVGQQRYSEAQIIAASGLQTGQDFSEGALQSAVQKLGGSGAFDDVEYRYMPAGDGAAIELTVKETPKFHPLVFDNFVWLTRYDIEEYLRKQVPLFSDALPESGAVLDDVDAALQQLLASDKVAAQVGHLQYTKLGSGTWSHLFSATGPEVKIKSVRFQGAQGMDPAALKREAAPLVGRDYSLVQSQEYGKDTFLPLYRQYGYLRIAIMEPTAQVLDQPAGTNQYEVEVAYPVLEGLVYNWDSIRWSGNQALAAPDLESLMGMKKGELANGNKIDAGLEQVNQGYGKKGYVEAKVKLEPAYDDASRTVSYSAAVSEGQQYHMGAFTVAGVPSTVAGQLQSKWRLKPADIYDSTYLHDYLSKFLEPILAAAQIHASDIQTETHLNRDVLTVDVSILVKLPK